ncbi:phage tail protein [Undibacterium sp. 5I1]|uniref:phage tail protein n=1 Tax=Undibacterium sp. 5I1 TaxID=3048590 RepID=UPI002AB4DD96|nr:phage tail protein [Undibacterium sp. 5I1]MDY7537684.1 phage tail protein [Undibacterium sp. 5I1]MEB0256421.1 phage tail protein [Undibacterium sp. 5I1]
MGSGRITLGPGDYTQSGNVITLLDSSLVGEQVWVSYKYKVGARSSDALGQIGLSLFNGSYQQVPFGSVQTTHPTEALGYRGTAYVAGAAYDLGDNAELLNHAFEIDTQSGFSSEIRDACPKDILIDFLTNPHYGAGFPADKFGDLDMYHRYCVSNYLFFSPAYLEQAPAHEMLTRLMTLTNSGIVYSEGQLKIIPYGDVPAAANGLTYTPNLTPIYDLTDDDFLADGTDPITVTRTTNADAFNQVQIKFYNRDNSYNDEVMPAQDQANIELYGLRASDVMDAYEICDAGVARQVAQLLLQRSLYIRNTYEFKLGWSKCLLEPMDLVTLTDPGLGLIKTPVRIISIEEDEVGELSVVAEEFPNNVCNAARYQVQRAAGYQTNFNIAPGHVVPPIIFEPPAELTGGKLQLWCAVTGQSTMWGGCTIWVSLDGNTYKRFGVVESGARYGYLTSALNTTDGSTFNLNLVGNGGHLLSGTSDEAKVGATACLVGDEYLGYTNSTLVDANSYKLDGLQRAMYSSTKKVHMPTERFVRLDGAIFKSEDLLDSYIGKQLHFKFTSHNVYGSGYEGLADVAAYTPPAGVSGTAAVDGNYYANSSTAADASSSLTYYARSNDSVMSVADSQYTAHSNIVASASSGINYYATSNPWVGSNVDVPYYSRSDVFVGTAVDVPYYANASQLAQSAVNVAYYANGQVIPGTSASTPYYSSTGALQSAGSNVLYYANGASITTPAGNVTYYANGTTSAQNTSGVAYYANGVLVSGTAIDVPYYSNTNPWFQSSVNVPYYSNGVLVNGSTSGAAYYSNGVLVSGSNSGAAYYSNGVLINGSNSNTPYYSNGVLVNGNGSNIPYYSNGVLINGSSSNTPYYSNGVLVNGTGSNTPYYSNGVLVNGSSSSTPYYSNGVLVNGGAAGSSYYANGVLVNTNASNSSYYASSTAQSETSAGSLYYVNSDGGAAAYAAGSYYAHSDAAKESLGDVPSYSYVVKGPATTTAPQGSVTAAGALAMTFTLTDTGAVILTVNSPPDASIKNYEMRDYSAATFPESALVAVSDAQNNFYLNFANLLGKTFRVHGVYVAGGYAVKEATISFSSGGLAAIGSVNWSIEEPNMKLVWPAVPDADQYAVYIEEGGVTRFYHQTATELRIPIPKYALNVRIIAVAVDGRVSAPFDKSIGITGLYKLNEIVNVPISVGTGNFSGLGHIGTTAVERPDLLGPSQMVFPIADSDSASLYAFGYNLDTTLGTVLDTVPGAWFRDGFWRVKNGYYESPPYDLGVFLTGTIKASLTKIVEFHGDAGTSFQGVLGDYLAEYTGLQMEDPQAFLSAKLYITSDPPQAANWAEVIEGQPTAGRYIKLVIEALSVGPLTRVRVTSGAITLDVPDLTQTGSASMTSATMFVGLSKFNVVSTVLATPSLSARMWVTNVTKSGFTLNTDSSTFPLVANYFVKGY